MEFLNLIMERFNKVRIENVMFFKNLFGTLQLEISH